MAKRSVFKFFGSLGPGGAFVALTEKVIRVFMNEAYDLGDEDTFKAAEEAEIAKLRHEFVNELFDFKSTFDRKSASTNPLIQFKAYADLHKIIEKFKRKITFLERAKLHKERAFYHGEENQLKADAAAKKLETVDADIADNLTKMANHILKPNQSKLQEAAQQKGNIAERVTRIKAEDYLTEWKKLKFSNGVEDESNTEVIRSLKDKLFIQTGEDVEDIFEAFNYYQLDTTLTQEDKQQFTYSIQ